MMAMNIHKYRIEGKFSDELILTINFGDSKVRVANVLALHRSKYLNNAMQWFNCPFPKCTHYMVFTIRRPSGHLSCIIHSYNSVYLLAFFSCRFSARTKTVYPRLYTVFTCLVSSSLLSNLEHRNRYLEKHRCHRCSSQSCTQLHEVCWLIIWTFFQGILNYTIWTYACTAPEHLCNQNSTLSHSYTQCSNSPGYFVWSVTWNNINSEIVHAATTSRQ